jgi:hypothetical protein
MLRAPPTSRAKKNACEQLSMREHSWSAEPRRANQRAYFVRSAAQRRVQKAANALRAETNFASQFKVICVVQIFSRK